MNIRKLLSSADNFCSRRKYLVLVAVLGLSATYLIKFAYRGWIPYDEGYIALSAERVLNGEVPHRDYDEGYTGGLTYLHALGFKLLGMRLTSLRLVLFVFALAFASSLYFIALRAATPVVAALASMLCLAWSLPNYFASLPSWYNLFFATFGTLCLLRHIETGAPRWLFFAGLCGGLSVLMKITGVYYVAAALLFFGYREQVEAGRQPDNAYTYSVGFVVFKALGLMLFTAVLFLLVRQRFAVSQFVEFVLPGAVISGYMMWNEIENGRGEFKMRFYRLLGFIAPFGLGFIGPILLFLFFYIWSGCFEDLYRGLVLIPQRQVSNVAWPMQKPLTMAAALPYAGLLCSSLFRAEHRERSFIPLLALLFVCLPLTPILKVFYPFVWRSAIWLLPFVVPIGCLLLVKLRRSERVSDQKRLSVFLMISMAAMISLVQYPFAAPIYFCYAAPLIAVAVLFIVTAQPTIAKGSHLAVLMFYLVFAICLMNPGYVYNLGFYYRQNEPQYTLELERGGIRVHEIYRGVYEKLVREIRLRAAKGSFIYAAPDCPEVYFLSGMQNPTRTMFDHLDDPVPNRADRILKVLEEKRVRVVVINLWPQFSRSLDAGLYRSLGTRFPHGMGIDWFVILWRDSD